LFKFIASFFSGLPDLRASLDWVDRLADEIGVDRKVFASALTEAGVNYAMWMKMYEAAAEDEPEEQERLRIFAMMLIPRAEEGLANLTVRFGQQPQILEVSVKMSHYAHSGTSSKGTKLDSGKR
jgi:hypothetical protein